MKRAKRLDRECSLHIHKYLPRCLHESKTGILQEKERWSYGTSTPGRFAIYQPVQTLWAVSSWQPHFNPPGSQHQEGQKHPGESLCSCCSQWHPLWLLIVYKYASVCGGKQMCILEIINWINMMNIMRDLTGIKIYYEEFLLSSTQQYNCTNVKYECTFCCLTLHLLLTYCNYTFLLHMDFHFPLWTLWLIRLISLLTSTETFFPNRNNTPEIQFYSYVLSRQKEICPFILLQQCA